MLFMNRVYKVIWSKARHCYVVVSELTKSQHKSSSKSELISTNVHRGGVLGKAAVAAIVAGLLTFGGVAYSPVLAADKDIVKGDGAEKIKYDISPTNDGTNIAVGKNAKVFIGGGTQESMLSFGEKAEPTYTEKYGPKIQTGWNIHSNEQAKKNLPEAIAIGTNSYARTGAIEIGAHTLAEKKIAIGDTTADKLRQYGVASTTLGTNSYTGGGFATTIGSYNVQTNQYEAAGLPDAGNATKNAFATVIGTFNSNESLSSYYPTSGVANMISGTANKVTNSNGAIVMGAGNSVKDSIASFDTSAYSSLFKSATDMQKALMEGVAKSAGGATLVIGGANSAEKTQNSQIMGVGNSMKSTTYKKVQYNYLDGFNSSITDASHVKVLGQSVTINKGADSNTVIGDYRTVAEGQTHNVIIGNADETAPITTEKKDTVILGHNANATIDGGVALGAGSVASRKADVAGYDPATKKASEGTSATWKATDAAVSVGKEDGTMTRQITGVAAGTKATDAVNVAQLKKAQIHYYSMNPKSGAATGANSNYNNNGATGDDAIAIGPLASAKGIHSLALGYGAQTTHSDVLDENHKMDDNDDNTAVGYNSQSGYRSTALGYNSKATGQYAVTLGTDALADKDNSTAVGMNAQAEGKKATALGSLARASGESATAVGEGAEALADYSSAVGSGAKVYKGATKGTALGYQAWVLAGAENSIALGAGSQVNKSDSIAIGTGATVTSGQSIAIGKGATVSLSRSVALGDGSIASTKPTDVSSITIPNLNRTYNNVSGNWPVGIVSVGTPTAQRTITNVAAGRVTSDSTDAVNGSELFAVATEAARHATVKAAANGHITVKEGVNQGQGIEYTIDLNTDGLAKSTDGLTFAGDDGQSDNSKVISRKLNEQLNIVGGATDTVNAANIGVIKTADNTLNIRLAKYITGLTSLQATTVTSGNVTVDGQHNVIKGLSNTTWDKTKDYSKSTKAATEAQLHDAMTQAAADANDTHIKAGDYAVGAITDKNGQSVQGVSIDVVDKTGTVGTVRITDVAKASDVGDVTKLDEDIQNADGKTTVVDAVNKVNGKVGDLNYSSTKYVTKGDSVTTSIGKLDEAIKSASEAAGKHTIVSTKDANLSVNNITKEGEAANYQISLNKDLKVDSVTATNKITTKDLEVTGSAAIGKVTINKDDKGTIGELTNKTWDAKNITSGQAATEDQLQAATKNAVNYDGDDSKTVTLRKDTTIQNVANTTIEEGSKNAVNAGTVYKETRVGKDGIFIRQANTAGENITALDHQVAANTESIYHMNGRISDLDNRVNKVGAGAAALAALHPLDFDPDDKWDFAVGYGNYRNANSVALGAFYRPNEDTMFSLGTNFGNGENMFNAGLSFKIGQGGSGITTSKTAMAKKIESLENTVDQQDKKIAELEALVKEQGEMIRQYVGKK